jgi:hypothetical protein
MSKKEFSFSTDSARQSAMVSGGHYEVRNTEHELRHKIGAIRRNRLGKREHCRHRRKAGRDRFYRFVRARNRLLGLESVRLGMADGQPVTGKSCYASFFRYQLLIDTRRRRVRQIWTACLTIFALQ